VSSLTVDQYLDLPYTIELTPDEDVGWFAEVRELSGCMSDGDSPDAAIRSLREAMRDWIAAAMEDLDEIPLPRSMEEHSGKFLVRTSPSLHRRLARMAEEEGVSTNQLCVALLTEGLSRSALSSKKERENVLASLIAQWQSVDTFSWASALWKLDVPRVDKVALMPTAGTDVRWHIWSGEMDHAKS